MQNLIFFDGNYRKQLLPFTFTRPVAEIRIGILTIREKWEGYLHSTHSSYITENYLSVKYPCKTESMNIFINGSVCPNERLANEVSNLPNGYALYNEGELIAVKGDAEIIPYFQHKDFVTLNKIEVTIPCNIIKNPWDIFFKNDTELRRDFDLVISSRKSITLNMSNQLIGSKDQIFLEAGAKAECCIFNSSTGPIYIGKYAEIMEGSIIRGPFAIGANSQLKLGTKIYGATTIGPNSRVGGEVNNSVIFGNSNKAHDGFLGNSVIGEWCNLGADTNNSNLKNNYAEVKLYSYAHERMEGTGLQFCGLMMGDHSKCGINTMFNTGTVVGVSCNIFGGGFPPTHIPSFSWGGSDAIEKFKIDKALELADRVYNRRNMTLTEADKDILTHIANMS